MSFIKKFVAITSAAMILFTSVTANAVNYIGLGTITGNAVNVRSGAGTDNSVVATAYGGGQLRAVEQSNGWTKVELSNGSFGYISSDYISVSNKLTGFVTGSVVNVREGAGIDYKAIGTITYGQSVDVIGSENSWFAITYNGVTGYVCGEYITFEQLHVQTETTKLIDEAKTHLGKAYVYGASGPNSFDCSGFTSYVYKKLGYKLNRTAAGQYSNGEYVSKEQLRAGDLVMFGKGYINHVGIYIGNNQFIHAENSRTGVVITSLDASYYASSYVGARRILS